MAARRHTTGYDGGRHVMYRGNEQEGHGSGFAGVPSGHVDEWDEQVVVDYLDGRLAPESQGRGQTSSPGMPRLRRPRADPAKRGQVPARDLPRRSSGGSGVPGARRDPVPFAARRASAGRRAAALVEDMAPQDQAVAARDDRGGRASGSRRGLWRGPLGQRPLLGRPRDRHHLRRRGQGRGSRSDSQSI